jgi:hypothetical protein
MREVWEREIGEEGEMRGAGDIKKKNEKTEKTCVVGRGKREKK